jgi:hypothetical protein
MTNQEEFLRFVLPADTNFKSIWVRAFDAKKAEFFFGKGSLDIAELMAMARFFDGLKQDVYVALASQREVIPPTPGKKWAKALRKQPNLVNLQTFFLDIDVNADGSKPDAYATQGDAATALMTFCADIGLPAPSLLVDSGSGGLHVYWRLDKPLAIADWLPIAHSLASATRLKGLKCDAQCTVDSARILRVPGTHNYKRATIGKVTMTKPGQSYAVEVMKAALDPFALRVAASGGLSKAGINSDLSAGVGSNFPPIGFDEIANAGCALFYDLLDTEGATLTGQPLWNLAALACTFDHEPVDMLHGISRGNKDYTFGSAQQMIERKLAERQAKPQLGWPHCREFNLVASQCATCPFLADDKTPFHLVLEQRKQDVISDPANLPHPYSREPETGHIKGLAKFNGAKEATYGVIMPYPAYDAGIWTSADSPFLVFKSVVSGKERFIQLPLSQVVSTSECVRVLAGQGIMIAAQCHSSVRDFMTAWSDQLQKLQQVVKADSLGWNDAMSFAYGESVYMPNGTTKPAFYGDDSIIRTYSPKGSLADWQGAAKIITDQKRPELEVIVASAFAAPLVKFASGDAVLLSAYSRESGIGKSTAMKIGQAVWGHPVTGMNGLDDTENAVMKKVGDLGHLPLYWDEIKTKGQQDKIVSIAFSLSQGKGKARLTKDIKSALVRSFSTMFITASNDSLVNIVLRGTKGTAAGVYRVFEIVVPPAQGKSPFYMTHVQNVVRDLDSSHGHAGQVYAEYLGKHGSAVKAAVSSMQGDLEQALGMEPQERYWAATMATLLVGAAIAVHLKLVDFDLEAMKRVLVETFTTMRSRINRDVEQMAGKLDIGELLDALLSSIQTKHLLVTDTVLGGPGRPAENKIYNIDMGARLTEVWAQLGLKDNVLRVKQSNFKDWLHEKEYNVAQVIDMLERHNNMQGPHYRTLGSGTALTGVIDRSQTRCLDIEVPPSFSSQSVPSASSDLPGSSTPAS